MYNLLLKKRRRNAANVDCFPGRDEAWAVGVLQPRHASGCPQEWGQPPHPTGTDQLNPPVVAPANPYQVIY